MKHDAHAMSMLSAAQYAQELRTMIADFAHRFSHDRSTVATPHLYLDNEIDEINEVALFLENYHASDKTFTSYRKEVDRIVLWSRFQRGKSLRDLTSIDAKAYAAFLLDPMPRAHWVQKKGSRRVRTDTSWRPFLGPLSLASRRLSLSVLRRLFAWLVKHAGFSLNPFISRNPRDTEMCPSQQSERVIPNRQTWQLVKDGIAAMPDVTPRARARRARLHWLFYLLHTLDLSLPEICRARMRDIAVCEHTERGMEGVLHIHRANGQNREIALDNRFFEELIQYRLERDLSEMPSKDETLALVLPISGMQRACDPSTLHQAIRTILATIAHDLYSRGRSFHPQASLLLHVSTRWL